MKAKYTVTKADGSSLDCPAVVFLAKDVFALPAIRQYVNSLYDYHPNINYRDEWHEIEREFLAWRADNPEQVKVPD